jgi:putative methionine-R-sulfoxide reductase with GAF domain
LAKNNKSKLGIEELNAFQGITQVINSAIGTNQVLNKVLTEAQRVINADAATLWLINEKIDLIEPRVVSGPKTKEFAGIFLKKGEGIAGKVIEQKEAELVTDVLQDPNWTNRIDSLTGFTTSSILTVPINWNENPIGCFQFVNKKDGNLFSKDDLRFAMSVANLSAIIITNAQLYEEQKALMMSIARTLTAAIDARDPHTKGHSERVKQIALKMGKKIGLSEQKQTALEMSAFLHDIGKIGVSDNILLSQDKLTSEEYEKIKEHTSIGANIIAQIEPSYYVKDACLVALYHQEKFDGSGYPTGLKGKNIPLMARIVGIADAFDAMTSYRPYRKSMNIEKAVQELIRCKGTQFDPDLVEVLLALIDEGGIENNELV